MVNGYKNWILNDRCHFARDRMADASKKSRANFAFVAFKRPAKWHASKISGSYENVFLPSGSRSAISVAPSQKGYFVIFELSASTESIRFLLVF